MSSEVSRKDLVLLVADQNMKAATDGLLGRRESLQIRPLNFDTYVHPEHDPGCLRKSADFLRPFARDYKHALVMFDCDGCGRSGVAAEQIEQEVEQALGRAGWEQRAAAVVLDPELEIWVWSDSRRVDHVLGWANRTPDLRSWLVSKALLKKRDAKPLHPKEAMERALREVGRPRSSKHYLELARLIGLSRCGDGGFLKFCRLVKQWFPSNES